MITLSQICKQTGVTRRILQGYDAMGLLRHRTTPGGYWLYDDSDIMRLSIIEMLRHAGYTRNEIAEAISSPDLSMEELVNSVQASLMARRNQLDTLMMQLETFRPQEQPPISAETS